MHRLEGRRGALYDADVCTTAHKGRSEYTYTCIYTGAGARANQGISDKRVLAPFYLDHRRHPSEPKAERLILIIRRGRRRRGMRRRRHSKRSLILYPDWRGGGGVRSSMRPLSFEVPAVCYTAPLMLFYVVYIYVLCPLARSFRFMKRERERGTSGWSKIRFVCGARRRGRSCLDGAVHRARDWCFTPRRAWVFSE